MIRTALVLGGGQSLHDDIAAYSGHIDGVVACNDAGIAWPGPLDAWVSLHPRFWHAKHWLARRAETGAPPADRLVTFPTAECRADLPVIRTDWSFVAGGAHGSSGLFAAKVALVDLGFDRAVLCGIPMDPCAHFFGGRPEAWTGAELYRPAWLKVPDAYRARMRSMSGWTRGLLGAPEPASAAAASL